MIFDYLFKSLKAQNNNDSDNFKRRYSRRDEDRCVAIINENIYPVQNWSMGGTLIRADERMFGVNDEVPVTIKFKMGEDVKDVSQLAKVVRKTRGHIAFQFAPLTTKSRKDFEHIIDKCMVHEFAESQMA